MPFTETVLFYNDFFQADGAGLPPFAIGSASWTFAGTWSTAGNRAYASSQTGGASIGAVAWIDAGVSDCHLSVRIGMVSGTTQGIVFRFIDNSNYIVCRAYSGTIQIYKITGGLTLIGSYSGTVSAGDKLAVDLAGPSITVRLNGATVITATDSAGLTSTKHGLHMDGTAGRLKHFVVATDAPAAGNGLMIANPLNYRTWQRGLGAVSVTVAGTYAGSPASIEAQAGTADWAVLDASPAGGTFTGTLTLPGAGAGWQGTVRARFSDDHGAITRAFFIGVGDVFVVAGQSNADGRFDNFQRYSHATLRAGKLDLDAAWDECVDPTNSLAGSTGSVWPLIATPFLADQSVPVAFLTTSHYGAGLISGVSGLWTGPGQTTYDACVSTVAASGVNGVKAVLWYQGENEGVASGLTQSAYENALKSMRASMQTSFGFGVTLPLVTWQISSITGSTQTRAAMDAVRLAQSDAASTDANIFGPVCLYDQDTSIGTGAGAHLTTDAQAAVEAARAWRAIKAAFYGGAEGRGPRLGGATYPDSTHVDVAFTVGPTPVVVGAAPTVGWLVTSDSGTHTVTGATALNSTTIRLTLGSALGTNPFISFASYNDGVGATVADSGSTPAPAEPFVSQPVTAAPPPPAGGGDDRSYPRGLLRGSNRGVA